MRSAESSLGTDNARCETALRMLRYCKENFYAFHVDFLRIMRTSLGMQTPVQTPVEKIIDAFGGISALARAMGHKNPSTVQGWRDRGCVPARQIPSVIAVAERLGAPSPLSPADFFDETGAQA